jgi:chondroitin AC lyase
MLRFLLSVLCCALCSPVVRAKDPDLVRVQRRMVERLVSAPPREAVAQPAGRETQTVEKWLRAIDAQGCWSDIDYDDKTRGIWTTSRHLDRVLEMAKAYRAPAGPMRNDAALLAGIHTALGWWLKNDYRNSNWWHNQIGVPRAIGSILLLLEPEITSEELRLGVAILSRSSIGMTGQNRVWLAGNVLMRALLEDNAELVRVARDAIDAEIVMVTSGEGLQVDQSFHQHGPQFQQGNYGLAFASDGLAWLETFSGTRFELDASKLRLLGDYIVSGENTVVWNGMMDISACARQLFPDSQATKGRSVARLLMGLPEAAPDFSPLCRRALRAYENAQNAEPITGNTLFWRSDYMVDRRTGYYASVKMHSPRVIGAEVVNEENLSGGLLADGALFLYRSGREFENIYPVWDWHKLPGVTCSPTSPLRPDSKQRNAGAFVGGVSNGSDGVAVLDYDRHGVKAKKSWFFFDGRIVCLGAGISSDSPEAVSTGVAQCLLNGPVIARDGEDANGFPVVSRQSSPTLSWAWHDGIGYVFPQPARAVVGGVVQTGSWKKNVYAAGSETSVSKEVFSLWIDHGTMPQNESYAYVLLPGVSAEQTKTFHQAPDVEVLANSSAVQAVRHGAVTAIVFHEAGQFDYATNHRVTVDRPCLLLFSPAADGFRLMVSDPTQTLAEVNIVWGARAHKVELPSGPRAGGSVQVSD